MSSVADPRAAPRVAALILAMVFASLVSSSCAGLVQYTDELRDERTNRSLFVRSPATVGGIVGFAVGLPVSAVALPITYPVYAYQRQVAPMRADPVSTLLFPSFVLWRTGALLGAPFDVIEWGLYRVWVGTPTLTAEEREHIERQHDELVLQSYPVETLYPNAEDLRSAAAGDGDVETPSDSSEPVH